MKVRDVVKDNTAWKELFRLVTEVLDAGAKAHDGGLYLVGLQLSRIVSYLADIDVPEETCSLDELLQALEKIQGKKLSWNDEQQLRELYKKVKEEKEGQHDVGR